MPGGPKLEYLNGHPAVNDVSVDLLHKMDNGRDVGVDVRMRGKKNLCILVHRSSVTPGSGTGRAACYDVLLPDDKYSVYQWDATKHCVKGTGVELSPEDAAQAVADADGHYRKTKGLRVSLSTVGRNNDPYEVQSAARRNNTITAAYLDGTERGQSDPEDGLSI